MNSVLAGLKCEPVKAVKRRRGRKMARGWESKAVEAQIEASEARKRGGDKDPGAQQRERQAKRDSLLLSRTCVLHDLETARHERHRQLLRAALEHLDAQLSELDRETPSERSFS
jgi:hypothetical protein